MVGGFFEERAFFFVKFAEIKRRQKQARAARFLQQIANHLRGVRIKHFGRRDREQKAARVGVRVVDAKHAGLGDLDQQLRFVAVFDSRRDFQRGFERSALRKFALRVADFEIQMRRGAEVRRDEVFGDFERDVFDRDVVDAKRRARRVVRRGGRCRGGVVAHDRRFLRASETSGSCDSIHAATPPASAKVC